MSSPTPPSDTPDPKLARWLRDHRVPGEPSFDSDAAWSRFKATDVRPIRTAPLWRRPTFLAAVTSALAAALAFVIVSPKMRANGSKVTAMVTHTVADGRRDTITLNDGSRITLNGGSSLRYAPGTGKGDRDVYLEGEGFFEIAHDPRRAFRVHAAAGIVQDIGTKFTVRAYSTRMVEVAVAEGSVVFGRDATGEPRVNLAAGDAAAIDSTGAVAKLPAGSLDRFIGWTTGALVFDNTSLAGAAQEIERRFGVHVVVADAALARRPVVARFHGEPVGQVLDAIALALGAHYDVQGSTYTMRPGRR